MHAERIQPSLIESERGIIVLSGYGIDVRVERGQLKVEDGIGLDRHVGSCTVHSPAWSGCHHRPYRHHHLDAIRWLDGIGASLIQLGADGEVLGRGGLVAMNVPPCDASRPRHWARQPGLPWHAGSSPRSSGASWGCSMRSPASSRCRPVPALASTRRCPVSSGRPTTRPSAITRRLGRSPTGRPGIGSGEVHAP